MQRSFGLDVHLDFCEVAVYVDGQVSQLGRIASTPEAIGEFAAGLRGEDQVALEASCGAIRIAGLLKDDPGNLGAPDQLIELAGEGLATLDTRLAAANAAAAGQKFAVGKAVVALDALRTYAHEQDAAAERHASLRDEDAQRKVMSELKELQARVKFVQAREQIEKHVAGLKAVVRIGATGLQAQHPANQHQAAGAAGGGDHRPLAESR